MTLIERPPVGSRVRCIRSYPAIDEGLTGTVVSHYDHSWGDGLTVKWDNHPSLNGAGASDGFNFQLDLIQRRGLNGRADLSCAQAGQAGAETLTGHALDSGSSADRAGTHARGWMLVSV